MQFQDSIFHSGFLGEIQFKFDLKKMTFGQKSEVVICIQEKPQERIFQTTWGSIQEWGGSIQADTVIGYFVLTI